MPSQRTSDLHSNHFGRMHYRSEKRHYSFVMVNLAVSFHLIQCIYKFLNKQPSECNSVNLLHSRNSAAQYSNPPRLSIGIALRCVHRQKLGCSHTGPQPASGGNRDMTPGLSPGVFRDGQVIDCSFCKQELMLLSQYLRPYCRLCGIYFGRLPLCICCT